MSKFSLTFLWKNAGYFGKRTIPFGAHTVQLECQIFQLVVLVPCLGHHP